MSRIHINKIKIQNYRSFGEERTIVFPNEQYNKPIAIVGYNNAGKTNLLNAILFGIRERFANKDTFTFDDFHNREVENIPRISTYISASTEIKNDGNETTLAGYHFWEVILNDNEIESAKIESYFDLQKKCKNWRSFGANKYYKIFYINFHDIKKEISTKKTSWGNLTSFLAKHIRNIVNSDNTIQIKKEEFKKNIKSSTNNVIQDSKLEEFISNIKNNYSKNLRNNSCNIEFGLPDYEDIFLEMMFKVGLNGNTNNLIPIDHFGDGYISMFVMAVIQAIAEENKKDKCLFIFEEPESFLHENHQEYFYKVVLCGLAEQGNQVIYTTHSAKMIDIFDTKGLVRVEFNENTKQTDIKYNNSQQDFLEVNNEVIDRIKDYNNYIKVIEPNLNKIIFSKKVILVEGPNDMMVYKEIIRRKVLEKSKDPIFADAYLNFNNISIIAHHGKITAILLIQLCKHLGLEYFVINDFDFDDNFISELNDFDNLNDFKKSEFYLEEIAKINAQNTKGEPLSEKTKKAMMTNNWNLINNAGIDNIHFNIPKLEKVIGYDKNDKNSFGIWESINTCDIFYEKLFPQKMIEFLEIDRL